MNKFFQVLEGYYLVLAICYCQYFQFQLLFLKADMDSPHHLLSLFLHGKILV